MDDIKKIANFMGCLVYTDKFLYVTIFISHKKTKIYASFSANIIVIPKLINFFHLHEQIKLSHKIVT